MRRLLLAACICVLTVQSVSAQSIEPQVFRALQSAQAAQQAGKYADADKTLRAVKTQAGSLEQALVWRSHGYLVWAQGHSKQAIELLDKAFRSGHLTPEQLTEDQLNLAKLNVTVKNYSQALKHLQNLAQTDDVLDMQIQAWQGMGRLDKALPLAERYLKGKRSISDSWLQFMVGANAQLKRYNTAEHWQMQVLKRDANSLSAWKQLAALQQMQGQHSKSLATLRTAYAKGIEFKDADLDHLIALASASQQPWQAARLLEGMLKYDLLPASTATHERLAQLHWQAREYKPASEQYARLAKQTGSGQHWLSLAQLEIQQGHWNAGLQALSAAEKAGANQQQIRAWRDWAQSRIELEKMQANHLANT